MNNLMQYRECKVYYIVNNRQIISFNSIYSWYWANLPVYDTFFCLSAFKIHSQSVHPETCKIPGSSNWMDQYNRWWLRMQSTDDPVYRPSSPSYTSSFDAPAVMSWSQQKPHYATRDRSNNDSEMPMYTVLCNYDLLVIIKKCLLCAGNLTKMFRATSQVWFLSIFRR